MDVLRVCPACRNPKTWQAKQGIARKRPLSVREKQVVARVALSMPNKVIAAELHLTEGTIKEYLNRIFKKLAINNRTQLAVWEVTRVMAEATGSAPTGN